VRCRSLVTRYCDASHHAKLVGQDVSIPSAGQLRGSTILWDRASQTCNPARIYICGVVSFIYADGASGCFHVLLAKIQKKMKKRKRRLSLMSSTIDDNALAIGASVACLVSVFEPATLGASLQITGEQSRFAPDFVAAILAALWETAGIQSSWKTFFVDPEYRPNPKDYFPNEQLLQFTLTLKSTTTR
jgi:hypothetical protein